MKRSKLKKAKEKVKNWWDEHKTVIKVGTTCLVVGCLTGFIKGNLTATEMFLRKESDTSDEPDEFVYDETTVDDPDLLELIKQEQEETTD